MITMTQSHKNADNRRAQRYKEGETWLNRALSAVNWGNVLEYTKSADERRREGKKWTTNVLIVQNNTKKIENKTDKLQSLFPNINPQQKVNNHQFSSWNLCFDCCCLFLCNECMKKSADKAVKGRLRSKNFYFEETRTHSRVGNTAKLCSLVEFSRKWK